MTLKEINCIWIDDKFLYSSVHYGYKRVKYPLSLFNKTTKQEIFYEFINNFLKYIKKEDHYLYKFTSEVLYEPLGLYKTGLNSDFYLMPNPPWHTILSLEEYIEICLKFLNKTITPYPIYSFTYYPFCLKIEDEMDILNKVHEILEDYREAYILYKTFKQIGMYNNDNFYLMSFKVKQDVDKINKAIIRSLTHKKIVYNLSFSDSTYKPSFHVDRESILKEIKNTYLKYFLSKPGVSIHVQ